MLDLAGLDRIDHLVGDAEHRVVAEADQMLAVADFVGEPGRGERRSDDGGNRALRYGRRRAKRRDCG